MPLPPDLSIYGKNILNQRSFKFTKSSDNGIWKLYEWTNSTMQFLLTYDRGYYDCDICIPDNESDFRMSLIPLLKFLRNDKTFYNKQLKETDLLNTLTPEGYIILLDENYDVIRNFMRDFDISKFENYKKFDFDYESI